MSDLNIVSDERVFSDISNLERDMISFLRDNPGTAFVPCDDLIKLRIGWASDTDLPNVSWSINIGKLKKTINNVKHSLSVFATPESRNLFVKNLKEQIHE